MIGVSVSVRRLSVCLSLFLAAFATHADAQTSTSPGQLTAYSTIHSIGVEWDIAGDSDHDARVDVEYRQVSGDWRAAMPLVRMDANGRNMLAGSVMFLTPDTEYVVRLSLLDPDGGGDSREVTVRTRRVPSPPSGGRVFHVVPGSGGGDGSASSPFRGVAAAESVAQAGDTFLLHAGSYGGRIVFTRPGTAAAYVAWRAAGDGEVTMAGVDIYASHLWLEGLTVRDQQYGTRTQSAPTNVVLTRSFFYGNHYSIFLSSGGSHWYITDNTIVGNTPNLSQNDEGEGIELLTTSGHTVAHNRITNVADGISYPKTNVDIFGNDIFDTADDGIELDFGQANVRVWGNRIHNPYHNGVSFQPQSGGPWYIVRNQIVGGVESPLKFRTVDHFVLLHNTIVNWGGWMFCCQANDMMKAFSRNNLWISASGGQMWGFESQYRDWRTDLDYEGFDWGNGAYPFWFDGNVYYDVPSFSAASGMVPHGIRVRKDSCFQTFQVPGPTPTPVPPQIMALDASCNAVDAGAFLPNVNDGYAGGGPDLGAHEYGRPAATYGPRQAIARPSVTMTAPAPQSSFVAPASVTLTAAVTGAVTRVDFYAGAALIGTDHSSPYSVGWSGVNAGSYDLFARASDAAGNTADSPAVPIVVTSAPVSQPGGGTDGWVEQGVGAADGSAAESGGTWTVRAAGADVWGAEDAFRFVHRELTGDGSIVARVASLQNTHPWAKAGVMMRASLAPDSAHAFMFVTPAGANGLAFQRRLAPGGTTAHVAGASGAPPVWVRLSRSGETITASHSPDGVTWTTVGSDTIPLGGTVQVGLAFTSHASGVTGTATFDHVTIGADDGSTPAGDLPSGWLNQDVGAVGAAGGAVASDGAWAIAGAGADVWGSADAFHFAYRALPGNGTIVARVTGIADTHAWAKAGVMVRGSLQSGSPHAFMFVTPGGANGLAFQRRASAGGLTTHTSGGGGSAPVWVRLVRNGNTVTASRSADGKAWTDVGSDTIEIGGPVYVGLAATSHDASAPGQATFDNVSVEEAGAGAWSHRDIGSVGAAGDASVTASAGTVTGSGADIWGTSDAFHYAYTSVSGDFSITTRVTSLDNVHAWTKAGLMIRASTAAGSAHVSLFATPGAVNGIAMQRRASAGASTVHIAGAGVAPVVWLRLSRSGHVVSAAYRQSNSGSWTPLASESLNGLPDSMLVGLAVTSHETGSLATGTFDNIAIGSAF